MPSQVRIDDIVASAPLIRSETIHLPHPFRIHPSALNPTKDLIVLFRTLSSAELSQRRSAKLLLQPFASRLALTGSVSHKIPTRYKGLGLEREEDEDEDSEAISFGLWRSLVDTSGPDVASDPSVTPPIWEADIPGRRLAGMTWNKDGSILSLLVQVFEKAGQVGTPLLKLVHLSLDDGAVVGKVYLRSSSPFDGSQALEMFWMNHDTPTAPAKRESPWEVLDLMPQPNAVEEYVRSRQGPFATMKAVPKSESSTKKRAYHGILSSFPASSFPTPGQSLLCVPGLIMQSGFGISFYGYTFPLPYTPAPRKPAQQSSDWSGSRSEDTAQKVRPSPEELEIGRASFTLKGLLDVILKGIEHCQGVWKDGVDKERIKWIDELEEAAKSHGSTLATTHADLTRLLLAGRSGEAVAQFLGGRITDKTLAAWEQAHYTAVEKIHTLVQFSVKPACEHLLVLGEWLLGLAVSDNTSSRHIDLEVAALQTCLGLTRNLAMIAVEMDTTLAAEAAQFRECAKWLRHEIARAAAGSNDEESLPPANHDVLSVIEFLCILLDPPSCRYFSTTTQQLDCLWPRPYETGTDVILSLKTAVEQTQAKLSAQLGSQHGAIRSTSRPAPFQSQDSVTGLLWATADPLTHEWEQLVKSALRPDAMSPAHPANASRLLVRSKGGKLALRDTADNATVGVVYLKQRNQVHIWKERQTGGGDSKSRHCAFTCSESRMSIVDINFYDDENILVVAERTSAQPVRYLCQIRLSDLDSIYSPPIPTSIHQHIAHVLDDKTAVKEDRVDFITVISRAQKIASGAFTYGQNDCLASNGRPRRRLVCVSAAGGKELEVFEIE